MTNTQIEKTGRRAELRKANEKALKYLDEEIPGDRNLPRDTFDKANARGDQELARSLFGVLLRELVEEHDKGTDYLVVGGALKKIEVTPEALLTALKDVRQVLAEREKCCRHCGAERRAA